MSSILAALVGSSKQLIIFNEEIIVAICFVAFVVFIQRGTGAGTAPGDTIKNTFTERQTALLSDLQHYLTSRETYLTERIKQHQLRSTSLRSSIQMIAETCIHDIITKRDCEQTVQATLLLQIAGQLKTFVAVQDQSRELFQSQIVARFRNTVCNQFRFAKLRKHQSKLVQQSIKLLKQQQRS